MIAVAIGYLAFVLLALSLMVSDDLKFRWLNLLGCVAFIVYGILIEAFPVILTNSVLFLINLVYIIKNANRKQNLQLVEFEHGDKIASQFISLNKEAIQAQFPSFKNEFNSNEIRFVVMKDTTISTVFIAELDANGTAHVIMNYTPLKQRDEKLGQFIFNEMKQFFLSKGIRQVVYDSPINAKDTSYLKRLGFSTNANASLIKTL